ncbi:PAS domain-containing protein [Ktedonospora formicarum]|uniref:PAS domain-containing protein n=1 Tax=Ktedonospora formicarum TaxID=2778364 RepID=UPI0027DD1310|nr:PAS domain-containing protein [Ktedonospora formicarum]
MQFRQLKAIWESFPEGLIVCDRNQKILRINAAARTLFEVASEAQCSRWIASCRKKPSSSHLRYSSWPNKW